MNDAINIGFAHNGIITPTTTDWIGLYPSGATPVLGQADIWAYLDTTCDCQTAPLRGNPTVSGVITASSSAVMNGVQNWPITSQTYDIYYFSRDSLNVLAGPISIDVHDVPTMSPSSAPSEQPSASPSHLPTLNPSASPSFNPR